MKFRYPVNYVAITQEFSNTHRGIDLGWNSLHGGSHQPIYASQDGKVIVAKDNDNTKKSWGNYVKIDHGNNIYTLYAHLKKGVVAKVGQEVKMGDLIGYMGNTGDSKGNHLHFEIYEGGADTKYRIDPQLRTYVYPDQKVSNGTAKKEDVLYYTNKIDVIYQIYSNKKKKYYSEVRNDEDYAGGSSKTDYIGGIRAKLSDGTELKIQSHVVEDVWLSPYSSKNYMKNDKKNSNSYSGIYGSNIDGITIKCSKPLKYKVFADGKWLGWCYTKNADINNWNVGVAGIKGKPITRIIITEA